MDGLLVIFDYLVINLESYQPSKTKITCINFFSVFDIYNMYALFLHAKIFHGYRHPCCRSGLVCSTLLIESDLKLSSILNHILPRYSSLKGNNSLKVSSLICYHYHC